MKKVLVITGPTASGKSALSMELASRFPTEIISADSMQVYRGMDIGTDKVSPDDAARVRHHLIDVKEPSEPWSVEEFKTRAAKAIDSVTARGNLPLVVGGTGLYIRALLQDFPLVDAPPDLEFRQKMSRLAIDRGNQAVHALLQERDEVSWKTLHPNDLKRVVRALEYKEATGEPISDRRLQKAKPPYEILLLALAWDRQVLSDRIDNRVEAQFARGFVAEVQSLFAKGYREDLPSMQGLGYKEIGLYLRGLMTLQETKNLIKRNTRRFCKRQFTWFSKEEGMNWVAAGKDIAWTSTVDEACRICEKWFAVT